MPKKTATKKKQGRAATTKKKKGAAPKEAGRADVQQLDSIAENDSTDLESFQRAFDDLDKINSAKDLIDFLTHEQLQYGKKHKTKGAPKLNLYDLKLDPYWIAFVCAAKFAHVDTICDMLGISIETYRKRRLDDQCFDAAIKKGRAIGKLDLRFNQSRLARTSARMAEFLGINYLGQSKAPDIQINVQAVLAQFAAEDGVPIEMYERELARLTNSATALAAANALNSTDEFE